MTLSTPLETVRRYLTGEITERQACDWFDCDRLAFREEIDALVAAVNGSYLTAEREALAPTPPDALRDAAQEALDLLPDLSVAYHQVGSLRDHADPKDKTGWNLHGIETCEDVYCLDALAAIAALRAALAQPKEDEK